MNETITFDIGFSTVGDPVLDFFLDDIPMPGPVFEHKCTWGAHTLKIAHSGKTNHTPDQFVQIDSVIIDGVNIQDILYTDSINTPEYPEPWATQQRDQGIKLEQQVIGQCELAFNCVWCLPFTSPFYEFVMDHVR